MKNKNYLIKNTNDLKGDTKLNNFIKSLFRSFTMTTKSENHAPKFYDLNQQSTVFKNLYINRDIPSKITLLEEHAEFLTSGAITHLHNIQKGLHGENLIERELKKLALNNSICLHNVLLDKASKEQQGAQFDFLLITSKCIFIIESKWTSSKEIKFDKHNYYANNCTASSPKSQLANEWMNLYNTINSNQNIPLNGIPIFNILVYANNDNLLIDEDTETNGYEHICKIDALNAIIIEHYRKLTKEYCYSDLVNLSDFLKATTYKHLDDYHLHCNALHDDDYKFFSSKYKCSKHNVVMQPRWNDKQKKFYLVCPKDADCTCGTQSIYKGNFGSTGSKVEL